MGESTLHQYLRAVGAVLSQLAGNEEHPVYFHSMVQTDAEWRCSVTERKTLAVVVDVVKSRSYILGRLTMVQIDHSPIVGVRRTCDLTNTCALWNASLMNMTSRSCRAKDKNIPKLMECPE